ncbi:MAG: NAD-dependent DNA ligase LigA [Mycoplasma sp.]
MEKIVAEKRIKELIEKINQWSYEYYALDNSTVTDFEFDKHLNELKELETLYPEFKSVDSPTVRVGGIVSSKFEKIKHIHPMLSLDNAFNEDDLERFITNVYNEASIETDFIVEPKIDGLSISVIYENSKLKYAVTRGDGVIGEDVTNNVKTIRDIPLYISDKYKDILVEVRGEIYIDINDFNSLNSKLEKKFANPRNVASGTIRNLDSSVAAERKLKAFMYNIPNPQSLNLETQFECLEWLKENNFRVSPLVEKAKSLEEVVDYVERVTKVRDGLTYEIDGLVIKLNQIKYYDNLGYTSKFPKWAIAYKFPANIVSTKIIDIELNVGRTGKVSYIAILEPVLLDGSMISAATLHNYEFIRTKNIMINSYINIYKAGDVIPYVKGLDESKDSSNLLQFPKPTKCPSCNYELHKFDGIQDLYCINSQCAEKIKRNIEYFASRNIMNIEGLSYAIISKFYDNNLIKNQWDLYSIKDKENEIYNLNLNIKEKSFKNLTNAIELSKGVSLECVIAALGIKYVGKSTAKLLAKKFKTLENFFNVQYEELISIHIVGEITANEIMNYLDSSNANEDFENIKKYNINTSFIEQQIDGHEDLISWSKRPENANIHNKTVVITGTFSIPREKIKTILETIYNCKVTNSVTKKTDFLIVGSDGGSKLNKAIELKVKLLETEFWNPAISN